MLYLTILKAAHDRQRGAAMPEYGLLVALIAIVVAAGATTLGINLLAEFNNIAGFFG